MENKDSYTPEEVARIIYACVTIADSYKGMILSTFRGISKKCYFSMRNIYA